MEPSGTIRAETIVLADPPDFREDVESIGWQTTPELVLETWEANEDIRLTAQNPDQEAFLSSRHQFALARGDTMPSPVSQALIDAAHAYEALFVPALFQQWAPMVADAAKIESGDRVLDIACGTGVLAREAARRTGRSDRVAALDPNAGMLAVARSLAPGIVWQDGAAEALPFPDCSFDVVVCQFGLMFFSDRDKAVREMLRVMVPGGRCAVAVWHAIENAPAFAALVGLLDHVAGKPAGDALRAPFALGDRQVLATLFKGTGASSINLTTCKGAARFSNMREFVEAELRGWLPVMGVVLPEPQIDRILAEAETILARYVTADGLAFDISAHLATCRRP